MMNADYIGKYAFLLSLLRASLSIGDRPMPGTNVQWQTALSLARQHAVAAVAYPAVRRMREAGLVPEPIYRMWRTDVLSIAMQDERVLAVQDKVLKHLQMSGMTAAVHKGASVARFYPAVGLRAMGDVDVLTRLSGYSDAISVLETLGVRETVAHSPYHTVFYVEGVPVELHKAFARIPEGAAGKAVQEVMDGMMDHIVRVSWSDHVFYSLCDTDQAVALLMHMQKHMTSSGIGLRQLCDWMMFVQSISMEKWSEICAVLKRTGLMRYCEIMTCTCIRYLGLRVKAYEECMPVDDKLCRMAMEDILRGGDLLNGDNAQERSKVFLSSVGHRSSSTGTFFKYFQHQVRSCYTKLYPIVPLRPFLYVFFGVKYVHRHRGEGNVISDGYVAFTRHKLYKAAAFYQPDQGAHRSGNH